MVLQGQGNDADTLFALNQLKDIVMASDISPFEVNYSGLIRSLLHFLTRALDSNRDDRLRAFLHVFANCPVSKTAFHNGCSFAMDIIINKLREKVIGDLNINQR